jgi:hypothetical protein
MSKKTSNLSVITRLFLKFRDFLPKKFQSGGRKIWGIASEFLIFFLNKKIITKFAKFLMNINYNIN